MKELRTCKRCKIGKSLDYFNRDPTRRDGLHPYCTPCKTLPYKKLGDARWGTHRAEVLTRSEKACTRCSKVASLQEFGRCAKALDGRKSWCKRCEAEARRLKYDSVKAHVHYQRVASRVNNPKHRESNKSLYLGLLGGKCADCGLEPGEVWPLACFDFHHEGVKRVNIGHILKRHPLNALEELSKCVVLCANCHRRRHHRARQDQTV